MIPPASWVQPFRRPLTVVCAVLWIAAFAATHVSVATIRKAPLPSLGDSVLHLIGYLGLTGALLLTLLAHGRCFRRRTITAVAVMAVYATVDEYTQPLFGREAALAEWSANLVGAALAIVIFELAVWAIGRRHAAKENRPAPCQDEPANIDRAP
ncbi:hypothetical protein LCGC14_0454520 [marine sediment metagenome]|uniref:VanZ-like domain-containing protein n=1 Tax=marine sediment metagenome TaxID=412755 RepID=A0A0F9SLZ5_9ZZZZ|nr:hypothetical protein [Phycisphaerae bacterium]HDZ45287.1 hypothetical protein [Phycisphaerae bacterium]